MRIVSFESTLANPFQLRVVQCSVGPINKDIVVSDFCAELDMGVGPEVRQHVLDWGVR